MNYRAFCNYMSTIQNAIDAEHNHHPGNSEITFRNNGKWALRLLEKIYADKDRNLRRWLNGKPCRFTSDITGRMVEITIGNDLEALYYQPTHISVRYDGLSMNSKVLLEQLCALDKSRLKSRAGKLNVETMKRTETALLISVGMKEESHGG